MELERAGLVQVRLRLQFNGPPELNYRFPSVSSIARAFALPGSSSSDRR